MEFDFEAWAKLARDDPEEFERRREAVVRATIESAPPEHRQRLEGLQFQINMERQRSGSALGACIKLNTLMWGAFSRLRKELNGLANGTAPDPTPKATAQIIPMQQRAATRGASTPGDA